MADKTIYEDSQEKVRAVMDDSDRLVLIDTEGEEKHARGAPYSRETTRLIRLVFRLLLRIENKVEGVQSNLDDLQTWIQNR